MPESPFSKQSWEDVFNALKRGELPPHLIGSAIVRLGKPLDQSRILAAKAVVASYLGHSDGWVRREAMWFLTSWGRLREYEPALILALREDSDPDNRSFAATCLGRIKEGTGERTAVAALKTVVEDEKEEELVRLHAYAALRQVVIGAPDGSQSPHDTKLADIDWGWVASL